MNDCKICIHLINDKDESHFKYFTGKGKEYYLICEACKDNIAEIEKSLEQVSLDAFKEIDEEIWNCSGIIGEPQILIRESNLYFKHNIINIKDKINTKILGIAAADLNKETAVYIFTDNREIISINFSTCEISKLYSLSQEVKIDFSENVSLHISKDENIAAIVNTFGQYGVVIDLIEKTIVMHLDRGDYHVNHCVFPIAFFEDEENQLMVHGTDWNRLDISNPKTGKMLTKRSSEEMKNSEEYYLDYFHSDISISCDNKWIVDNGWVWHPVGQIRAWNLNNWLKNNIWEAEVGNSNKIMCERIYYWDGAICWINDRTIAVYGLGEDDDWIIPGVRILDVETVKEIGWFPGPKNHLIYDEVLFSCSREHGTEVWDLNTGERLLIEESFNPCLYHRGSKRFISILSNGEFMISSLEDDNDAS